MIEITAASWILCSAKASSTFCLVFHCDLGLPNFRRDFRKYATQASDPDTEGLRKRSLWFSMQRAAEVVKAPGPRELQPVPTLPGKQTETPTAGPQKQILEE